MRLANLQPPPPFPIIGATNFLESSCALDTGQKAALCPMSRTHGDKCRANAFSCHQLGLCRKDHRNLHAYVLHCHGWPSELCRLQTM